MIKRITRANIIKKYWASEAGDIFCETKERTGRLMKSPDGGYRVMMEYILQKKMHFVPSPKHRHRYIRLRTVSGAREMVPVHLIIIETFKGIRGKGYMPEFKDGDHNNCKADNLRWRAVESGFYDILTDEEYVLWAAKLDSMPCHHWEGFNKRALDKFEKAALGSDKDERMEFFRKLFAIDTPPVGEGSVFRFDTLTDRQNEVLSFIKEFMELKGFAPTYEEIAVKLNINRMTAKDHVERLVKKGCLESAPGTHRGLTFLNARDTQK